MTVTHWMTQPMSWLEMMIITSGFISVTELFPLPIPHPHDLGKSILNASRNKRPKNVPTRIKHACVLTVCLLHYFRLKSKKSVISRSVLNVIVQRNKITSSSLLCVGTMAAGHLQTQLEAATWTLLSWRIMHLLCIKGRIQ